MSEDRALLARGIKAALRRIPGSRYEIAGKIGCSATSLDRWCSGASAPRDRFVDRIARLSGLDQDDIRNGGRQDAA